jgi:hypothetical protein
MQHRSPNSSVHLSKVDDEADECTLGDLAQAATALAEGRPAMLSE